MPQPAVLGSQTIARLGLGAFMTFTGVAHLTFSRQSFQAQVPDWFPLKKDTVVFASGVAEIGLGAGFVALPRHRRLFGVTLAGFYAVVFPGSINQYAVRREAFKMDTDGKRLLRLFFQPALIAGALWGAGLPSAD